jgi:RNA polymerase sigma-70 factor (ECF subfamily)
MGEVSLTLEGQLAPASATGDATGATRRARALVEDNFDFIWRSLRQLGVAEADVDDAAQQVFVIATQKLEQIAPGCERSYVYSITLRIAARARRSRDRRREVSDPELSRHQDPSPDPEEVAARRRALELLDEVLAGMALPLRAVFTLYELEEVTVPEIATLLGIPVGTAASRLRRARQQFHDRARELEQRCAAPKGGVR